MGVLENLADDLAKDALAFADDSGDEHIVEEISAMVGATSSTLQEAYQTSVRMRRAEARGRKLLGERISGQKPDQKK